MRRSLAIALGLIFSVTVVGVAYASWTSPLSVAGFASTGALCLGFQPGSLAVTSSEPEDQTLIGLEVVLETPQAVSLCIDNAYPGCSVYLSYRVTNLGTLPARIKKVAAVPVRVPPQGGGIVFVDLTAIADTILGPDDTSDNWCVRIDFTDDLVPSEVYEYKITIDALLWFD